MQLGIASHLSKFFILMIVIACTMSPSLANANQVAQGLVQLSITALSYPYNVTSATCNLSLQTFDQNTSMSFTTDVTVEATPANNTISCTVTAAYYWSLTALTGTIGISYSITAQSGTAVVASTSGGFDPIPVTTTGTTPLIISTIF
jgi:hypothetical protein